MSNIEITREAADKKPQVKCHGCLKPMILDIKPFEEDATRIVKSNCPYCGQEQFVGILLIGHKDLRQLGATIQKIIDVVQGSAMDTTDRTIIRNPK